MHPFPTPLLIGDRYFMPTAARAGSTGTITTEPTGYLLSGFDNNTFAYINAPMTSRRFYWELQVLSFNTLTGIASSLSPVAFGGYTGTNAGVYVMGGVAPWAQSSYGGSFGSWSAGTVVINDILGFAYDTAGTFSIYRNNVLGTSATFATPPATTYAHSGFQGGAGRFRLGPGGCVYGPPGGFDYL